jgi:hypothetical protein
MTLRLEDSRELDVLLSNWPTHERFVAVTPLGNLRAACRPA